MTVPLKMMAYGKEITVCQTNFLCVHKKLREKRMAQIQIGELLRRTRRDGKIIGFYHAARFQPTPFVTTKSALRLLNTNKLIDVRYTSLPMGKSRQDFAKQHQLPKKEFIQIEGTFRLMEAKDVGQVHQLYHQQMKKHSIYFPYTEEEIAYHLLPRDRIVKTFVVEQPDGSISDFMSFTYYI